MASNNRISIGITPDKKTAVEAAVQALKTALPGVTLSLSADERTSLPRIADKTLAFDAKCESYVASRPDLVPNFIDLDFSRRVGRRRSGPCLTRSGGHP